jgi:hypothetical protein
MRIGNAGIAYSSATDFTKKNYGTGALFLLVLAATIIVNSFPFSSIFVKTWITTGFALIVVWGYLYLRYKTFLPLRSNTMFLIGLSLLNLLPQLYLSCRLNSANMDPYNVADVYPLVAFLTAISALCFMVGYNVCTSKTQKENPEKIFSPLPFNNIIIVCIGIAILTWGARFFLLTQGVYYWAYNEYDFLFGRWFSLCSQIARYGIILPVLVWLNVDRNKRWLPFAWGLTILEFLWIFPSGAREILIEALVTFYLVSVWRHHKIHYLRVIVILSAVILLMPVLKEYRYTISQVTEYNQLNSQNTIEALQKARDRAENLSGVTFLDKRDRFFDRLYDGQFFGFLLKHYQKDYAFEWGKTYLERLPYVIIPYFMTTDRPIMQVPLGDWYKLIVGGSQPVTFLGEAFINFGYFGILLMSFLLGMLLSLYDNAFRKSNNVLINAVYIFFLASFIYKVTAPFAVWLAHLRTAILIILLAHLVFKFWGKSKQPIENQQ